LPGSHPKPNREFVHDERFEQEREEIEPDFWRFDKALQLVEEVLCVNPEKGIQLPIPGIWICGITVPAEGPKRAIKATIFYSFDENKVRLRSIREANG
jgi:hypothetical protein